MPLLRKVDILFCAVLTIISLGVAPAWASEQPSPDENEAKAAQAFQLGQTHYSKGEYLDAAHAFERAYRLAPHPSVLANIGYCYDKLGDYPKAIDAFRRYLQHPLPQKDKSNAKIKQYLESIETKVGRLRVRCVPTRCEVFVDDRAFGVTPTEILLKSGHHTVQFAPLDGGQIRQYFVNVPGGGDLLLEVDLAVSHPPPPADDPLSAVQTPPRLRAPFWVATSTTIAGVAATAVLVGASYKTRQDFFDSGSSDPALKRRGENLVAGINIAAGVTAAAATAAVTLAIIDLTRRPREDPPRSPETDQAKKKPTLAFSPGHVTSIRLLF